ncbi:MAG: gamma-glutamylcyclotransferase family protein, partial [Pseudonocardiaceae bacterium]
MPLYAAYGSNMDPAQMMKRAPHAPMAGTGWLSGWR